MSFHTRIKNYPGFAIIYRKNHAVLVCAGCTARKSTLHPEWVTWMIRHETCTERG